MRFTIATGAAALILAAAAMPAAAQTQPTAPTAPSSSAGDTSSSGAAPDSYSGAAGAGSASASPSASASGADSSATASSLAVGQPVKDSTGATIGSITAVKPDASGKQVATIKMGTDTFAVDSSSVAVQGGAVVINATQAELREMMKKSGKKGG